MGRRIQSSPTSGTGSTGTGALRITGNIVQPTSEDTDLEIQGNGAGVVVVNDTAEIGDGTSSSSTTTGALIVDGGLGVSGAIYAGSMQGTPIGATSAASGRFTTIAATANTESTTSTNGTLVVTGGVGISGNLNVAGNVSAAGASLLTAASRPALGTNAVIRTNSATIAENITIPSGTNGMTAGPVTIQSGATVTVTGDWSIV